MKHYKILAFDSVYMVKPIRKLYTTVIGKIINQKKFTNSRLVLYRLDKDNIFLSHKGNISGTTVGARQEQIEAMSFKFYQYIEKSGSCNTLSINNVPLCQLYPRQVKLKLDGVLRCAYRIRNLLNSDEEKTEVITDRQTASIIKEAFLFLNYTPNNVTWKVNWVLTLCVIINSFFMRSFAIANMYISQSKLPSEYFYKHVNSNAPTVLISTPKNRPADFFSIYVEKLSGQFNIVLYCCGYLGSTPKKFKKIEFKSKKRILHGFFIVKNLFWGSASYIADILLIYKNHADLSMSIDVVNSVFSNQIDAHISRLQTNAVDTYLAIEARRRGVFILGDIEEEIFYCDSAVCPSMSEHTESLKLALAKDGKVAYKGNNSMINYRFQNFNNGREDYLQSLLQIDTKKKIIFYASTPSKEESQRYLTEKFLIDYFSRNQEFVLVMKTHPQDNGRVTNHAYLESGSPSNVILIGDIKQGSRIVSRNYNLFEAFDFNAAVASCNGFLTISSSSVLQAIMLGVKAGLVDIYNNAFYDYLIKYKAAILVDSEESLTHFLSNQKLEISDDILSYCGLKNNKEKFDLGNHLLKCLEEFKQNSKNKQREVN